MKKEMKKLMVVILGLICIICVWLTGTTGVREIRRLVCRQRELSVVYRVSDFVLGNGRMPFDQKELALWEGNRFLSRRLPFEMVFHSGTFNGTGADGVLVSRVDNGSVRESHIVFLSSPRNKRNFTDALGMNIFRGMKGVSLLWRSLTQSTRSSWEADCLPTMRTG